MACNRHLYNPNQDIGIKKTNFSFTRYDNKGLNIRTFKATDQRPFFWHCVGSNCDRYSFGYRLLPKDETHHH